MRRALLILLATIAANTLIAALLVGSGASPAFWPTWVYSQSVGFTIAALCWSVVPRVERGPGSAASMVLWFGGAIVLGTLLGNAAGWVATRFLFAPGEGAMPYAVHDASGALLRSILISLVLGVAGTLYFYGRERLRHARTAVEAGNWRALAAERSAAEAQLQALRAQVEPHFLFNTLANVSALIDRDPDAAKDLLEDLSRHLRSTLRHARSPSTTLGEELDVTGSLLAIMKRRLGDRLGWAIDVPAPLRALSIAPMLVQPLVENAVKHGIEPNVGGGVVEIRARGADGQLTIEVRDTGVGLRDDAPSTGSGTGLANLRDRLAAVYGPGVRLTLSDNPPRGTIARLVLPMPATAAGIGGERTGPAAAGAAG